MSAVYKIVQNDIDKVVYIGSTSNFNHRVITHKSYCNNEKAHNYSQKIYCYIRDNGTFENFEIVPFYIFPKEINKQILYSIEKYEIQKNIDTIQNVRIPRCKNHLMKLLE